MVEKTEYIKMRERVNWAFETLKELKKENNLEISDETLFEQSCSVGKCLFVRSEIQYSGNR